MLPNLQANRGGAAQLAPALRARAELSAKPDPKKILILGVAGVIGLAAIATFVWRLTSSSESDAAPVNSGPRSEASEASVTVRKILDPGMELANAKVRATAWNPDAVLTRIHIQGIRGGIPSEPDALIEYGFGRPVPGRLGPGSKVEAEHFTVTMSGGKVTTATGAAPNAMLGLGEPDCPLFEAWEKAVAAGLPRSSTAQADYESSLKHDRAVWKLSVAGQPDLTRLLDGRTCSVLRR
jgi:hypothetical protein